MRLHGKGGETREAARRMSLHVRQHLPEALFAHIPAAHVAAEHVERQLDDRGAVQVPLLHQLGDEPIHFARASERYDCSFLHGFQCFTVEA